MAARKEHLEKVIKPALKNGVVVISDRFMDSTSAYQGNARNIGVENVDHIQAIILGECKPDLTLFFDIKPEVAESRMNIRGEEIKNRLDKEKMDFKEKVYQGYKTLVKNNPKRIKEVDASKTIDEVSDQALKLILENLK
ncbi:dTMP kinase [Vibrio harveyi]|nr:dTMP kinase [Vibrio harveyi]